MMYVVGIGLRNLQWRKLVFRLTVEQLDLWYWNGEGMRRYRLGVLVRMLVHCYQCEHSYSKDNLSICIIMRRELDVYLQ